MATVTGVAHLQHELEKAARRRLNSIDNTFRLPWYGNTVTFFVSPETQSRTVRIGGKAFRDLKQIWVHDEVLSEELLEDCADLGALLGRVVNTIVTKLGEAVAKTPEGKVKDKVKKVLDELGCYHFSPIGGPYASKGVPDIIVCHNSRFIGIECKAGNGKTTALQEKNLADIAKAGGLPLVINEENLHTLKYKIEYFLENL